MYFLHFFTVYIPPWIFTMDVPTNNILCRSRIRIGRRCWILKVNMINTSLPILKKVRNTYMLLCLFVFMKLISSDPFFITMYKYNFTSLKIDEQLQKHGTVFDTFVFNFQEPNFHTFGKFKRQISCNVNSSVVCIQTDDDYRNWD